MQQDHPTTNTITDLTIHKSQDHISVINCNFLNQAQPRTLHSSAAVGQRRLLLPRLGVVLRRDGGDHDPRPGGDVPHLDPVPHHELLVPLGRLPRQPDLLRDGGGARTPARPRLLPQRRSRVPQLGQGHQRLGRLQLGPRSRRERVL